MAHGRQNWQNCFWNVCWCNIFWYLELDIIAANALFLVWRNSHYMLPYLQKISPTASISIVFWCFKVQDLAHQLILRFFLGFIM